MGSLVQAGAVRVGVVTGRRIRTQEEADELNAREPRDQHGRRIVFVVSTPESEWAEFCALWPRVAKWAEVLP
jgi:hypothetical protein